MSSDSQPRPFRTLLPALLVAAFISTAVAGSRAQDESPPDIDKLQAEFRKAFDAKDYAGAIKINEELYTALEPKFHAVLYNMACLHALQGDKSKAYMWLDRAASAGYWNVQHFMQDADFAAYRGEPRFRELARQIWANGYLAMLERDDRAETQKPALVMEKLAFKPGERVADIGAGSGYFTVPIAKAVGPAGKVWAIDIQQPMLDFIEKRLTVEQLENVELKKVVPDDPQLEPGSADTILMVDTIHYVRDKAAYAKKLRDGLAPGGRVVIIDFTVKSWEERPWGPPPEQQVARETLDAAMAEAGFKPARVHDILPEQYFVEYKLE